MKVLLIYPNLRKEIIGYGDLGAVAEPLALEYLGAGLADSHEVRILDLRLHADALDSTLEDFEPDLVGVTGYSMHVLRNLAICRRVKELLPTSLTVVGGHHATLLAEDYFEPQVDLVVCGEGVGPLREIVRARERRQPIRDIPGVWTRVDGTFVNGGPPPATDVDGLPFPDRSLTAADRDQYFIDWMKPIALLRTTLGCPYRCSFCSLWKIEHGRYHMRDIDRVVAEVASVREECIFLVDDEAFINGKRMLKLAQALKASGIRKRYFTYCRIDTLLRQPELMAAWVEVGLERLFIGIEAVSADELDVEAACARSTTPTLLVHGAADETVPFHEAERLIAAFPPGVARLVPVDGAGHTFGAVHPYQGATEALERAFEASLAFLAEQAATAHTD